MFEKLRKYLEPVESVSADEAKEFLDGQDAGSFTLLDVRQPNEYSTAHIPGATLIPLPKLTDSLDELDREKPIVVYCAVGGRSRVAAQLLAGKGFKRVYNLKGGINAWNSQVAEGPVEFNLGLIAEEAAPADIIRVAYGMETSLGDFYRAMVSRSANKEVADLLQRLASIEDKHKQNLLDLYRTAVSAEFDAEAFESSAASGVMEGGYTAEAFMDSNERFLGTVGGVLDLSMMVEAQALDLYLRFAGKADDEQSKKVLYKIADEEKAHLAALGDLRNEHAW